MRKPTLVAAVLSLWACSPEALEAMHQRTEEGLNELSHAVHVRFDEGVARLTVSRTLRNDTPEYQVLQRHLSLPEGAVATSLRVSTDGAWSMQATLTSSDEADARWSSLTEPGTAAPSTIAKLDWSWEGGLDLDLFGLAPGATVKVEYDLELPPDYAAGELSFEYPRDEEELAPEFQIGSARLEHTTTGEEGEETSTGFRVRQPHELREAFEAKWATYPLEVDRELWRLEVDVAAQLGPLPVRPNVVFVVDGSHSEGPEGIAAQLELIEPYLANVREAQVEIVIYRRFAERLFGRFVAGSDVARLLASTPPERLAAGNGSNLELGAGVAAQALAQVGGVGRLVIFTDEQVRFGFSNELAIEALKAAPRETVVHLVGRAASSSDQLSESRDDTAELSPIAAAWGGIFLRVDGMALDPVLSSDTMLGLVRPIRIDSFEVEAGDLEELSVEAQLNEGSTVRQMSVGALPPAEVVVTGKIWAREVRRVVKLDRALSERLPAFSIGDDAVRGQLSDEELKTVAFVSHAVSPVTSFFAAAPDARPSTVGVYDVTGAYGLSGISCGGCGGSSTCGWGQARTGPNFEVILRALLAPAISACEQQTGEAGASLRMEATGDEVVAVTVTGASAALTECLTEAVWNTRLSPEFVAHRNYELVIPAP